MTNTNNRVSITADEAADLYNAGGVVYSGAGPRAVRIERDYYRMPLASVVNALTAQGFKVRLHRA